MDIGDASHEILAYGVFPGEIPECNDVTIWSGVSPFQTRRANVCNSERNGLLNIEDVVSKTLSFIPTKLCRNSR